ncbi:MAG TPA: alpha,alpha-trehalase TreF [Steroidobacteraceae bacterium]|nr:alpha,alpha-trehalase TreF [Steroidobacteraceae bacterium]
MSGDRRPCIRARACLLLVVAAVACAALASGAAAVARAPAPLPQAVTEAPHYPPTPAELFGPLFVAVQSTSVFPDNKTFADATPQAAPPQILAQYRERQPQTPEALRSFVQAHFTLPGEAATSTVVPAASDITAHIDALWPLLTRETPTAPRWSSLLPLPRPYVVPGGRFREIYYWDSYFTMLGLIESRRADLVRSMTEDFAYLIDSYGHVPNGTRSYYLSRSQPPVFYLMVGLLDEADPAASFARFLPQLRREYAFWMRGAEGLAPGSARARVVRMPDGSILNRYWDDRDTPRDESYREDTELARRSGRNAAQLFRDLRAAAESGWDFSSRWLADARTLATIDTTDIVPVDLNSLLFGLEQAIGAGCARARDATCAREFSRRAQLRHAAIDRYLWDEPRGAYLDYERRKGLPVRRLSAATLYPLFAGVSSEAQEQRVASVVKSDLLRTGGIVTTLLQSGEQWDAPNGWAPLQWIAVAGLRRYHDARLAETIACRWMVNVMQVYRASGKLVEKYDVIATDRAGGGGEYPTQDGFGWTNGVMRKLMVLYPTDAARAGAVRCPDIEDVTP